MLQLLKLTKRNLGKSKMCSGDKFSVKITRTDTKESITATYNANYTNKVELKDVIDCLFVDADCAAYCKTPEDVSRSYGYTDYKEAARILKACQANKVKLEKLFNEEELKALREEVQY